MARLLLWLAYTIIVGLIPYGTVVAASSGEWFSGSAPLAFPPSGELIFLSLTAFASALAQIHDGTEDHPHASGLRSVFIFALVLGIIVSGIFFGMFVHHSDDSPGKAAGVDCAALAVPPPAPGAGLPEMAGMMREDSVRGALYGQWSGTCARWYRGQRGYFDSSVTLAMIATVMGGVGVLAYGPRGRRTRRFQR